MAEQKNGTGLVVHHLNNSRSQRIVWLLEELEVPYEVKQYQRHPETFLAQQDLKDLHPLGKSPLLTDGDTTVAESGVCQLVGHRVSICSPELGRVKRNVR